MTDNNKFPLYARVVKASVLDGKSALIVAPTATWKSNIGRQFCRSNMGKTEHGVNVYLVPFRALAKEFYETFADEQDRLGIPARIRIATGDHTDPIRPEEMDILVATYERFASLRYTTGIKISSLVADEFHLVADETRGPFVESLMARLRAGGKLQRFLGLSTLIENGRELANWLDIDLIEGTENDRA
jgi:helicase